MIARIAVFIFLMILLPELTGLLLLPGHILHIRQVHLQEVFHQLLIQKQVFYFRLVSFYKNLFPLLIETSLIKIINTSIYIFSKIIHLKRF